MKAFRALLIALALGALGWGACSGEAKSNLAEAKKAMARLEIGMEADEACWRFGVLCDPERSDFSYSRDFGVLGSQDEFIVTILIQDRKLIFVELAKPYYDEKGVRRDDMESEKSIDSMGERAR